MKKKNVMMILSMAAIALAVCTNAQAEMITIGADQTTGAQTITLNYDLVFMITHASSDNYLTFTFDEVVSGDDKNQIGRTCSGDMKFSINNGSRIAIDYCYDNLGRQVGDITSNDGMLFSLTKPSVAIGDVVTLYAGTAIWSSSEDYITLWNSGDHTVFITGESGSRISTDAVPEPASAMLLMFGASVGMIIHRVRRVAQRR